MPPLEPRSCRPCSRSLATHSPGNVRLLVETPKRRSRPNPVNQGPLKRRGGTTTNRSQTRQLASLMVAGSRAIAGDDRLLQRFPMRRVRTFDCRGSARSSSPGVCGVTGATSVLLICPRSLCRQPNFRNNLRQEYPLISLTAYWTHVSHESIALSVTGRGCDKP